MKHENAKLMMRYMSAIDLLLGSTLELINKEYPPEEREAHSMEIVKFISNLHESVRAPILREFPDLDYD